MAQEPVKVVVTISGGCCTGVYGDRFVELAHGSGRNGDHRMAWILGKATNDEVARLKAKGYEVEVGPFEGMEGFYGEDDQEDDADKDIQVYVDCDVLDLLGAQSEGISIAA